MAMAMAMAAASLGALLSGLRAEEEEEQEQREEGLPALCTPSEAPRRRPPSLAGRGGGGGGEAGAEAFQAGRFWASLAEAFEASSREATQLSLAFARRESSPDGEEASQSLAGGVHRAALSASRACSQLPRDQGATLRQAVRQATAEMVEGLLRLTEATLRDTTAPRSVSREQLVSTGGIWEACDRLSALPRDNQAAVALVLSSCLGVVRDALEEMEQAQTEGGDPDGDVLDDDDDDDFGSRGNRGVYWSEADRRLLGPCLGLVKSAKACLKKVLGAVRAHGQVNTAEQVAQLDDLAYIAGDVSPSVDELALSTYPPVNQLTLRLNAAKLASVLKKMLEITKASHICPPSEEGWVQFLAGAVDHNLDRIKGLTQGLL